MIIKTVAERQPPELKEPDHDSLVGFFFYAGVGTGADWGGGYSEVSIYMGTNPYLRVPMFNNNYL